MPANLPLRLWLFVPTFLVISLIGFGLSKQAPGDPVKEMLRIDQGIMETGGISIEKKAYAETASKLGLDKPVFYVGMLPKAYPDTLFRIADPDRKKLVKDLLSQFANWSGTSEYLLALEALSAELKLQARGREGEDDIADANRICQSLLNFYDPESAEIQLGRLQAIGSELPSSRSSLSNSISRVVNTYENMRAGARRYELYIPKFRWFGFDNQYHNWICSYIGLDFGRSYHDGLPVAAKIWSALKWTLLINGLAILLAFGLAIPLGVWSAVHQNSILEKALSGGLFMLYALPTFWIASLCLIFLTTPLYNMDLFPTLGPEAFPASTPYFRRFYITAWHLTLPVLCLTYPALALIVRQVRGGMADVLQKDYIRTAKAKGMNARQTIWKHAFRNALFPLITLSAYILPELIAGSVAIEVIFNIPGMGRLTVDSIFRSDWPVVYAVLIMSALVTMMGILVADVFYYMADPRLTFGTKRPTLTKPDKGAS